MTTFIANTMRKTTNECWDRWIQMVQQFVLRRRGLTPETEETFQAVRRELLDACEARETAADTTEDERTLIRQMEECASPWMSLESLRAAAPEILQHFEETVAELQRQRDGQCPTSGWKATAVFVGVFLVIFVGVFAWLLSGEWLNAEAVPEHFRRFSQALSDTFAAQRSTLRTAVIVACLGVLSFMGAYLVMRSPRID